MRKNTVLRISAALFLSVLWFLPIADTMRNYASLALIFAAFCAEILLEKRLPALTAAALCAVGIGLLSPRFLFFGIPSMLFPLCIRGADPERARAERAGDDGASLLFFLLFCGGVIAAWVYMGVRIPYLHPLLLMEEQKSWILPCVFILFATLTLRAFREEQKARAPRNKKNKGAPTVRRSAFFLVQLAYLPCVYLLTAETPLPVSHCLFAPLLFTYLFLTDPVRTPVPAGVLFTGKREAGKKAGDRRGPGKAKKNR